jgi:hypothetical protein
MVKYISITLENKIKIKSSMAIVASYIRRNQEHTCSVIKKAETEWRLHKPTFIYST